MFSIRLAATLAALGLVFTALRFLWYPGAYFALAGVARFVWILAGVTFVLGPCLTALVYRRGKPGLKFDLAMLALVEAAAVVSATFVLYDRRPFYAVFAVDRFEVIARGEIDAAMLTREEFNTRPGHAPRLVYAALPDDVDKRNALIDDVVFGGGADIDRRPEYWHTYATGTAMIRSRARPLGVLLDGDEPRARRIRSWLGSQPGQASEYAYLPIRGRVADATMIVHADVGYPVDILTVDPW